MRFCLSCGIAIAPDRLPDGFVPITNREKDNSTITEPLRRPRCRINSRQQSRLSRAKSGGEAEASSIRKREKVGRRVRPLIHCSRRVASVLSCDCYSLRKIFVGGHDGGVYGFRTIQVCPKDLPAVLRQVGETERTG